MNYQLKSISKSYKNGEDSIQILKSLNFVWPEEHNTIALVGESGSGKTSLLSICSGLLAPDEGEVVLGESSLYKRSKESLARYRAENFGIVFQHFHLLPDLNALENVSLPLQLLGVENWQEKAKLWLDKVGLSHRAKHRPYQLSGGEQQRVAIARALVHEPKFLFADEPSGSLDPKTGTMVMDLIFDLVERENRKLFLVTHNLELAKLCKHVLSIQKGVLDVASL